MGDRRRRRPFGRWSVVVTAALVLGGCSSGGAPTTGSTITANPGGQTAGSADGQLDINAAEQLLDYLADENAADSPDGESYPLWRDHLGDVAVLAVARANLDEGSSRWIDVYVWADGGNDPEPLRRFLDGDDLELRLVAAYGTVSMGDPNGFTPLIEALTDQSLIGNPPTPAWQFAVTTLTTAAPSAGFGPPFDASLTRRERAQEDWGSWLAGVSASSFDTTTGLWGSP